MEQKTDSPLPIIGTDQFGLTEKEVGEALQEAKKIAEEWKESLNSPNEGLRRSAEKSLPRAEERVQALSAPPGNVLTTVRTFYDRTVQLAGSGLDEDQLSLQLRGEFPDLTDFYELLRMKPWGYRLGQAVMRARLIEELHERKEK